MKGNYDPTPLKRLSDSQLKNAAKLRTRLAVSGKRGSRRKDRRDPLKFARESLRRVQAPNMSDYHDEYIARTRPRGYDSMIVT